MASEELAAALERMQSVLVRRPAAAVREDRPAIARWQEGARVATGDADGDRIVTDLPPELGGGGRGDPTPGWLLRAGLAACAATRIAMAAATARVQLASLEIEARSRSDARGLLGIPDGDGQPVQAAPLEIVLAVRIAAHGAAAEAVRQLADDACRGSPVFEAVATKVPVNLQVIVDPA